MTHSFDIEIAKKYGVEKAVLIHNLAFWIKYNKANRINYHDGYYWTFNSARAFTELFPYFNEDKISRMLKDLEKKGVLKSGNYNKVAYDRTKWYTIQDLEIISIYDLGDKPLKTPISQKCKMDIEKMQNGYHKNAGPIPDINTNINTDIDYFENVIKNNIGIQENNQSEFKNDLLELKNIIEKSTGVARQYIDATINPMIYKNKFDLKELIKKIKESDFLLGKLDTKPNLNNFSMYKMIVKIMADTYKNREIIKTIVKKRKVADLSEQGWHWKEYKVKVGGDDFGKRN